MPRSMTGTARWRFRGQALVALTVLAVLSAFLSGCGGGFGGPDEEEGDTVVPVDPPTGRAETAPQPPNFDFIQTLISDAADDLVVLPPEEDGTDYAVTYAPVDVTQVSGGVYDGLFYLRVDFAEVIPTADRYIAPAPPVEEQKVRNQTVSLNIDVDRSDLTGASGEGIEGVDIFFAITFDYGRAREIYANYDFPTGDIHLNDRQIVGAIVEGGAGQDYVIVRYDVSAMGAYFPRGSLVEAASWSAAESYTMGGLLKYHRFAFDPQTATNWLIP